MTLTNSRACIETCILITTLYQHLHVFSNKSLEIILLKVFPGITTSTLKLSSRVNWLNQNPVHIKCSKVYTLICRHKLTKKYFVARKWEKKYNTIGKNRSKYKGEATEIDFPWKSKFWSSLRLNMVKAITLNALGNPTPLHLRYLLHHCK